MTAEKRRIRVNAANLRNSHLYVTGLRDFFPKDAVGGPRRKSANGHGFDLILDGLGKTMHTDIASDAKSGRFRGLLLFAAQSPQAHRGDGCSDYFDLTPCAHIKKVRLIECGEALDIDVDVFDEQSDEAVDHAKWPAAPERGFEGQVKRRLSIRRIIKVSYARRLEKPLE